MATHRLRMWQERQPYDETRYLRSLQKRGLKIYADLVPNTSLPVNKK